MIPSLVNIVFEKKNSILPILSHVFFTGCWNDVGWIIWIFLYVIKCVEFIGEGIKGLWPLAHEILVLKIRIFLSFSCIFCVLLGWLWVLNVSFLYVIQCVEFIGERVTSLWPCIYEILGFSDSRLRILSRLLI